MDLNPQAEIDRLWQVVEWVSGGYGFVVAGLVTAIGHAHMRINAQNDRRDAGMDELRKMVSDRNGLIWSEMRRASEAANQWRTETAASLAALPRREEIRDLMRKESAR